MRGRILDQQALERVRPEDLKTYAERESWVWSRHYGKFADVYEKEEGDPIVIPHTSKPSDYLVLVERLISYWGRLRDGNPLAVYEDIIRPAQDRICVRAIDADERSIPIDAGLALVEQAREMLKSAVCSIQRAGPKDRTIIDYMKHVRLGQTEQGSFVVTLITPAPNTFQSGLLDDEPMEFKVTQRLVEALEASRKAADVADSDRTEAFQEAVSQGVNADLCDAISTLTETSTQIDISVRWARTRAKRPPSSPIAFTSKDSSIFKEAAENLRKRPNKENVTLQGRVRQLTRKDDKNLAKFSVIINVDSDNRPQSVSADLDKDNHSLAIKAYESQELVTITGNLYHKEQTKNKFELKNARIKRDQP